MLFTMKPLLVFVFILCLSFSILGQKNQSPISRGKPAKQAEPVHQDRFLIYECVNKSYTQNSCEKVFCHPWQRCVAGSCFCKLPYQCPKNGSSVCSTDGKTFKSYCQLKSFECQRERGRFMNKGRCNFQESFNVFLDPANATSPGFVQVKVNHFQKTFICSHGWTMNEANVACRDLGFPEGADQARHHTLLNASLHSSECYMAICRGTETSLAECALTRLNNTDGRFGQVLCHPKHTHRGCSRTEFRCVNGKCIPSTKTCNGINDCGDLSDELCCKECRNKSFHCHSNVCIPKKYLCNNERDCLTGEDESHQLCRGRNIAQENQREGIEAARESMDEERKRIKTLLPQPHCGVANQTVTRRKRILGGYTAEKNEFPWQVAIKGEGNTVSCGGVYIGGCWVLTAAHCVRASRVRYYRVWTGMLSSIDMNSGIETFSLNKVIVHEKYNGNTYENDIALLEMKPWDRRHTCMPLDSVPACVPWSPYMFTAGHQCKVSGWGLEEELRRQFALKWGYIYLMGNCSEIYKQRYFKGMECAGTHDGSVDSCKGDSGGPLVCFDSNNVGYIWGIVSWGENCGEKGYPGVYTKVADYFDWISRHTGPAIITRYNV